MTTILVIEDEEVIRLNILELLEAEGFTALSAENGRAGVRLAHERQPDLILCDVTMPELEGYGVLAAVRADLTTATLPFVFLTARAEPADEQRGLTLGANAYLTKPFTRRQLLDTLAAHLPKR